MRNSLELRSAYLDFKLFETVADLHETGYLDRGKESLARIIKIFFNQYEVDKEKIGFYVPFDEWFTKHIEIDNSLQAIIERSLSFLQDKLKWNLKEGVKVEKKLAWTLLNIGVFLDLQYE